MHEGYNYRFHLLILDSALNNSYMFQFAKPYGLKNAVIISLLELILIK